MRFAIAFAALLGCATLPARAERKPLDGFRTYVEKVLQDWDVPGVAIGIVKDGKVVFTGGYGIQKAGKKDGVTENTIFAIASCSKAITAASLAILVDEKKISWDDPVIKYLPNFQLQDPATTREITIRDLLCHRCGLARHDELWYAVENSRDEILRRLRFAPARTSFRSQFGYQNIMFLAAGQVVQAVTGKTWDEFVDERIFKPLGMGRTSTSTKGLKSLADVATPHERIDGKVTPIEWRNLDNAAPAGSINSTVKEMAEWVLLNLNEGEIKPGKRLISSKSIREMHAPQMVIRTEGMGPEGEMWAKRNPGAKFLTYGLGWVQRDYMGRTLIWHGGAIDGMRSQVALIPEEKLGIVLLSNRGDQWMTVGLVYNICDRFLTDSPKDWSAHFLAVQKEIDAKKKAAEEKLEKERVKDTLPSRGPDHYVGKYTSDLYGEVLVTLDDGRMTLRFGKEYVGELIHWHYDTFRATWKNPTFDKDLITFVLNAKGEVEELRWDDIRAKRLAR